MTVEAFSTDQAQSWFQITRKRSKPVGRSDPAKAASPEHDAGEEWQLPVAAPAQFIPRIFPGL